MNLVLKAKEYKAGKRRTTKYCNVATAEYIQFIGGIPLIGLRYLI
jgi:hypothetical protein